MCRSNSNPASVGSTASAWIGLASFRPIPGSEAQWGYSFEINTEPGPHGRSAGSASWAGLLNCYFWIDPVRKVTGSIFTQLLPFYDDRVVALYGDFERGLYDGLA